MTPPCQCLETRNRIGVQICDGLVMQLEVSTLQRLTKVGFDLLPVLELLDHGRCEKLIGSALARLDCVKREVCGHDKFVFIVAVLVSDSDPDADTGANMMAVNLIGLGNRLHERVYQCLKGRSGFDR